MLDSCICGVQLCSSRIVFALASSSNGELAFSNHVTCTHGLYSQLSVKNCFIRGSVVRQVQVPKGDIDVELLQDAARREAKKESK